MIEVRSLQKTYRSHGAAVGLLGADFLVPDGRSWASWARMAPVKPRCCAA